MVKPFYLSLLLLCLAPLRLRAADGTFALGVGYPDLRERLTFTQGLDMEFKAGFADVSLNSFEPDPTASCNLPLLVAAGYASGPAAGQVLLYVDHVRWTGD